MVQIGNVLAREIEIVQNIVGNSYSKNISNIAQNVNFNWLSFCLFLLLKSKKTNSHHSTVPRGYNHPKRTIRDLCVYFFRSHAVPGKYFLGFPDWWDSGRRGQTITREEIYPGFRIANEQLNYPCFYFTQLTAGFLLQSWWFHPTRCGSKTFFLQFKKKQVKPHVVYVTNSGKFKINLSEATKKVELIAVLGRQGNSIRTERAGIGESIVLEK